MYMNETNVITIVISVLSSSVFSLALSSLVFDRMKEKWKYVFGEKQRAYVSLVVFAQIALCPKKAKGTLSVAMRDIRESTDEENVKNALDDLKMAVPRLKLIAKNPEVAARTEQFVDEQNETAFNLLLDTLRRDLYR
jgi:hypothetical protein